ncbi:MAG: phosphate ABC transporter substrate-binding/OmpA family protein [Leptolyngbyaceae cyanobacterium bins.59]|nr:phosphate ABC transporter substrate-binding/OmpA family protein [Leptolyngbyaceae cyanobacterium bins.59]
MSKNSNLALGLALVMTATVGGGGVWLLSKSAPNLFTLPGQQSSGGSTSTQSNQIQQMTLLGDTFSGYSTFRNPAFQQALKEAGIQLSYADEFDQAKRADRLNQGQADLIVTTLDQFLKQKPKGKIVGLIDRTAGADAVVLNTRKYRNLRSLLDLNQLVQQAQKQGKQLSIAFAGETPSEYLALVLDTKFEAFNLNQFNVIKVTDASEAWKLLQSKQDLPIVVIWEPFVTQARRQGYTVVLSSQDAPGAIVDVLVASDRLIQNQPAKISQLLATYYRRIDANVRDASQLQKQIAEDGKLSSGDAAAVLQGIEFFTALEAQQWLNDGTLKRRIGSTAAVLTLSGRMNAVPSSPETLYTGQFLAEAANNTRTLVDLVRADNPDLASRLEGKNKTARSQRQLTVAQVKKAQAIGNLQVRGEVQFGTGSADLTPQGNTTLATLAQEIGEFNPQTVAVRVIGHTSRTGPADINQSLSQQRAQVVVNALRRRGLRHSIIAEGKGFSQPLLGVSPADSRNQRTEIRLVRIN